MEHQQDGPGRPCAPVSQQAHLFTLRLWEEQLGDGQAEWRGRVQDIAHGEPHYFRDWPGLVAVLSRLVSAEGPAAPAARFPPPPA